MPGMMMFPSLLDALKAGFEIYDRTASAYLVRAHTRAGWAIAFVPTTPG